MRVGPSRSYRISWLYRRPLMPLKVLRLQEAWRLVEDPDGQRGWMLQQFLSPERAGMVGGSGLAEVRDEPGGGRLLWRVEPGRGGQARRVRRGLVQVRHGGRPRRLCRAGTVVGRRRALTHPGQITTRGTDC